MDQNLMDQNLMDKKSNGSDSIQNTIGFGQELFSKTTILVKKYS